jgi:hypothetical protein
MNKKEDFCLTYFVANKQARQNIYLFTKTFHPKICKNESFYFRHFWCASRFSGTQFQQKGNIQEKLFNVITLVQKLITTTN